MKLKDFVERGYFMKELPPPFSTKLFADEVENILNDVEKQKLKCSCSKPVKFTISKGKLSRRLLELPNPQNFIALCSLICQHWSVFEEVYHQSDLSSSTPEIAKGRSKGRYLHPSSLNMNGFKEWRIQISYSSLFEIKVDISKFYPSIYTHSITWALLGIEEAKKYYKLQEKGRKKEKNEGNKDIEIYEVGDKIDKLVRDAQSAETIGIPIGPDTSFAIAELIASRIDIQLKEQLKDIDFVGCRYYDDYYLYVNSRDSAEKVLRELQSILNTFHLEVNESKLDIKEFPFAIEEPFITQLYQYSIKEGKYAISSIKHFFSIVWNLIDEYPDKSSWILKYALSKLKRIEIKDEEWFIFRDLLLKTMLIDSSILDRILVFFLDKKDFIFNDKESKEKLNNTINIILKNHIPLSHNYEISWSLYFIKIFDLNINLSLANEIITKKDNISILILLDIYHNNKKLDGLDLYTIEEIIHSEKVSYSENWLLAYESTKKKWISLHNEFEFYSNNPFFELLKDYDVEFYLVSKEEADDNINNEEDEFNSDTYLDYSDMYLAYIEAIQEKVENNYF